MDEIKTQSLADLIKLADKEIIDKIVKIIKSIEFEEIEGGTKVSLYLLNKEK